jgi:hypothetical protein
MMLSSLAVITPGTADEDPSPMTTTGRTVIVELFTGADCHPCVNANKGLVSFIDDHNRSEVVALVYHRSIPVRDKLETSETIARHGFYLPPGEHFSTPNIWVDGRIARVGGFISPAEGQQWFEDKYTSERAEANESQVSMTVDGIFTSTRSGRVWINVTALETPVESNLTLHTVIVRKTYGPWNGGNGILNHYWIVRKMLPDPGGEPFNISQGETKSFSYNLNLSDYSYTLVHDIAIVAFVQSHNKTVVDAEDASRSRYIAPILQSRYGNLRFSLNFSDRDNDGVPNSEDAFPDDISASVDTDEDGHPDEWNDGMEEEDSITHLKLDRYPDDPKRWKDADESPSVGLVGAVVAIGIIAGMMRRRKR